MLFELVFRYFTVFITNNNNRLIENLTKSGLRVNKQIAEDNLINYLKMTKTMEQKILTFSEQMGLK